MIRLSAPISIVTMRATVCCVATFIAFAVVVVNTGQVNGSTIVNGDFEATPLGMGWSLTNMAAVNAPGVHPPIGFRTGNPGNFVRLNDVGLPYNDPTASQTVSGLAVGTPYRLSWDIAMIDNHAGSFANGPSFGVFLDTQTSENVLFLGGTLSSQYIQQSTTFVPTSTTHTVIFAGELDVRTNGASTTDVAYDLDNVSLTLVPEPSTFILSIFGLIGLGFYGRRR